MDYSEIEFPVTFNGNQKWITGITKRTTCDDVIYALLRPAFQEGSVDLSSYVMYEKWRGNHKLLSGRTKLSKVWRSWGDEIENVTFLIRKMDLVDVWDTNSEVSRLHVNTRRYKDKWRRQSRGSRHHDGHGNSSEFLHNSPLEHHTYQNFSISPFQQQFSGPANGHEFPPNVTPQYSYQQQATEHYKYVQIILTQDKQLRDLSAKVSYINTQIEYYETSIHEKRQQLKGTNYIQSAYLKDRSEDSSTSGDELFPKIKANDLETYLKICESILDLQARIESANAKMTELSGQLETESKTLSGKNSRMGESPSGSDTISNDLKQMQRELEQVSQDNVKQQSELQEVQKSIAHLDDVFWKKQADIDNLVKELNAIESHENETANNHAFTNNHISKNAFRGDSTVSNHADNSRPNSARSVHGSNDHRPSHHGPVHPNMSPAIRQSPSVPVIPEVKPNNCVPNGQHPSVNTRSSTNPSNPSKTSGSVGDYMNTSPAVNNTVFGSNYTNSPINSTRNQTSTVSYHANTPQLPHAGNTKPYPAPPPHSPHQSIHPLRPTTEPRAGYPLNPPSWGQRNHGLASDSQLLDHKLINGHVTPSLTSANSPLQNNFQNNNGHDTDSLKPYITYVRYKDKPEPERTQKGGSRSVQEDSNSDDTGMSSLHSEEDRVDDGVEILPGEQGLVTLV